MSGLSKDDIEFIDQCLREVAEDKIVLREVGIGLAAQRIVEVREKLRSVPTTSQTTRQKPVSWSTEADAILLEYKDVEPRPWKTAVERIVPLRPGTTVASAQSRLYRLIKDTAPPKAPASTASVEAQGPLAAAPEEWSITPVSKERRMAGR